MLKADYHDDLNVYYYLSIKNQHLIKRQFPLSGICKAVSVSTKILAEACFVFDEDHLGFGEVVGVVGLERDAG